MFLKKFVSGLDGVAVFIVVLFGFGCFLKVILVFEDGFGRGLSFLWVFVRILWIFIGILIDFKVYKFCFLMKLLIFLIFVI